jgi:arylsulfatase A-like enzyme
VTPGNFGSWGNKPGEPWNGSVYVHNGKEVKDNLEGDDSRILVDRVIPFINKAVSERKPFFACVWFHAPHEPVVAGPEYLKMYEGLQPEMKRHYFGCITAMDEQIGRLRKDLAAKGIDKNTMIWFCSDNGPADPMVEIGVGSAGSFRGHKHLVYEGGIRVPSLLVWPGVATPGRKVDTRMCSYDYLPTIVDLAGLDFKPKKNYPVDGISLKPAINGKEMVRDTTIFSAWMRLYDGIDRRTLVGERYKLVIPEESGPPELYDLKNDPFEKNNIVDKFPKIAEAMLLELHAWEESCRLSRDGKDYTY